MLKASIDAVADAVIQPLQQFYFRDNVAHRHLVPVEEKDVIVDPFRADVAHPAGEVVDAVVFVLVEQGAGGDAHRHGEQAYDTLFAHRI